MYLMASFIPVPWCLGAWASDWRERQEFLNAAAPLASEAASCSMHCCTRSISLSHTAENNWRLRAREAAEDAGGVEEGEGDWEWECEGEEEEADEARDGGRRPFRCDNIREYCMN